MKKADASGASYAVIIGEDEIASNAANVKSLRGEEGEQQQATVPFEGVVDHIVDQIAGCGDDCDEDHHHHHHYH
jgi:histidyl-tRNA synthetase